MGAELRNRAVEAVGALRLADVAAVQQKPVVGFVAQFWRYVFCESGFHFEWCFTLSQAYAVGNTEHMGVNGDCGFAENCAHDHVGCFSPHAGKRGEVGHVVGHFAVEFVNEHGSHGLQVLSLGVGVRNTADELQNVGSCGLGHGLRRVLA